MKSGPLAMIIDDNAMVADVVRSVCASSGYRTKVFANAWDALSELSKSRPDIIVMDIHMPGLTGNDFLRRIAMPPNEFANTPIAIFSGDSDPAQIDPVSGQLNVKVFVKPEGIRQLAVFLKERRREHDEAHL
ncbi:MAG TPA: response regulator [Rhizomicrobium sp.]|nr:response regulator [Rhizomicrobium sp.]